jgi:type I restriction enzyme S subunit
VRNGQLPSLAKRWRWRKFGDCAQFINGRAYSQEELLDSGTPVLRIQNLNGGDRWYYSNLKLPDEKYCETGDLLYAWSASFGPYRFTGPKSIFHYHIWRVIPGQELDKNFAFHLLEEITNEVKSVAHGVAMLHMTKGGIEAWPIPLPPLAEQRRIAEVLDRAEALRAKRRAALAQLDSLTQSLFFDLFGDPVSNPKDWPTVRFGEICERVTVGIVVQPASYYVSEGVPALRSLNIRPGKIVLQDLVYFSKTDNETKLTKTKLKAGDIVLVRSGQPGTAAIIPIELDGVNAIDLLIATPSRELSDATFLCAFFNSAGGRDLVLSKQRGQVQKHLNVGSLNQAMIPLPPIELQREFARRVQAVEKLKTAQRASLAELDALFSTLQHRAFRGEL